MAGALVSKGTAKLKAANERPRDIATKQAAASIKVGDREIARRAYDLYLARGCENGHDVEDWLQAERELLQVGNGDA